MSTASTLDAIDATGQYMSIMDMVAHYRLVNCPPLCDFAVGKHLAAGPAGDHFWSQQVQGHGGIGRQ